ncbi:alpha/beta fold hydrolase [Motilimonas sp. E26]|uniref:alpha/beta fold hydrolase n=1 Tax=Motilimonas TaxID=1914248 RepID=UPI001E45BE76|nr:alpha/beta fold hydrolase [Motilimonas sp. E26]MCE0556736.1 alpha/beta fold hydrolase [Motilimonas sp. E26]
MQLNYKINGQGESVFLIHGLFGSLSNFGLLHQVLSHHYRVISIDVRNHGESPHHPSMAYEEMADDVLKLAKLLDIKTFSLVGHSMGGKIAMMVALKAPEKVHKLVVADMSPVNYEPRHQGVFAGLQAVAESEVKTRGQAQQYLAKHVEEVGVQQFLLKSLYHHKDKMIWRYNLAALVEGYSDIIAWPDTDQKFNGPTLFIKGQLSDYIIDDYWPHGRRHFPNAKIKMIMGTGHWLHAEKPAIFNKLVNDFLHATS